MLLDQQFPMERAFAGPAKVLERFGTLDPGAIAAADPEAFADLCATPPAIHRYGRSMAARIQALAVVVRDTYGGDASALWRDAATGAELVARLKALPGFGEQKARIFAALLGKQLGVRPQGWEEACGAYAETGLVPLGRRRRRRRVAAEGARLQEGRQGGGARRGLSGVARRRCHGCRVDGIRATPGVRDVRHDAGG